MTTNPLITEARRLRAAADVKGGRDADDFIAFAANHILAFADKIEEQKKEIAQLREEMESRNTVVVSLQTECEARISQLNIARSNWDSCQGKLGNIERVLNEYRNEETDIITNIEEWNGEFTSLRAQVATLTQDRDSWRRVAEKLEQQNADLKEACEAALRKMDVGDPSECDCSDCQLPKQLRKALEPK